MANELIFYKTPDGEQRIEVVYEDENFWMSQRALAELFSVKVPAISKHLKKTFESGELVEEQVVSILETVGGLLSDKKRFIRHNVCALLGC